MRMHQLGCRYVCTQSPDGEIRYFRATRIRSLRLFWIFRNFSDLHQHVLAPGQLRLILNCENVTGHSQVSPEELIGTVELSAGPTKGFEPKSRTRVKEIEPLTLAPVRRRSFAISAIATAATLAFVAAAFVLVQFHWGEHLAAIKSQSRQMAKSFMPRVAALTFRKARPKLANDRPFATGAERAGETPTPRPVWQTTGRQTNYAKLTASGVTDQPTLQSAAFRVPSLNDSSSADVLVFRPRSQAKRSSGQSQHSEAPPQVLPPAGPPESHPVLDEFSSVLRDSEVVLRAIVSPQGRVKHVKLLHGDARLGREATRVVNSWRYSSRNGSTDGESMIRFRFASDVTTISFLDSGSGLQSR